MPNRSGARRAKINKADLTSVCLVLWDLFAIHLAYFIALWIRFDCAYSAIPRQYLKVYYSSVTIYALAAILIFTAARSYKSLWKYAGYAELIRVTGVSLGVSLAYSLFTQLIPSKMPVSYCLWGSVAQILLIMIPRIFGGALAFIKAVVGEKNRSGDKVMVIGAGSGGQLLIRDMLTSDKINQKAVCIIDDDPDKWGKYVLGVPIAGGRDDIFSSVEKYGVNRIFFAIPSASQEDRKDILNICAETGCELKQLPGIYQLLDGRVTVSAMKDVSVEDLLGRDPIKTDMKEVFDFINGKTVMVTGGGGSIGSELCRQVAAHAPEKLIVLDIYENNAYSIQKELERKYPNLDLTVLIGSVRDSRRMMEIFRDYRPQIVYHAAAHKHVPLMEESPCEAIKNNAIGTYKTAYAAMTHGCQRFVLISTDKAVNPTNIMGASKRLCEMIIQTFDSMIKCGKADRLRQLFTHGVPDDENGSDPDPFPEKVTTEFVAVRFGNVLGSNGSVIPLFKKQIEEGGPVTVTHPDIIRYFMTIPEAVSLVMLAGTFAHGGEIFVLDMGDPVKIDTLARNLIKLCGFVPDRDIKIVYSGLRPGEKLYEEKLMDEEGLRRTDNDLIHIGNPISFDKDDFLKKLELLMFSAYENSKDIAKLVKDAVKTYTPPLNGKFGTA